MSYKIYKVNGDYQEIRHCFQRETDKIVKMDIIADGATHKFKQHKLQTTKQTVNHNEISYVNSVQIPNHLRDRESLTLKVTVLEEGYDHWAHLVWMSLYPTNSITYKIICKDKLVIKSSQIFDNQQGLYYVESLTNQNGNPTEFTITCDTWTDPYTGFSIVISEP